MATSQCTCQHPADRFWEYAKEVPSGCWEWQAQINNHGYGKYRYDGKMRYAHRLAWEFETCRDLSADMTIDHLCNNRACVNPDHLEPVSLGENTRRMWQRTREAKEAV